MEDAAPPGFLCPIGQTLMRDPVSCADGHSYERANIERWLQSNTSSPKTGAQLEHNTLVPNHALRNAIEEWLVSNFKLVSTDAVEINELIGRGSFKTVHRGSLHGHPVAVLKMADGGSCEAEAVKLVQLGRHPGLVRYLGICIDGPQQLLLTELAPLGSLDSFLEEHEDEVSFMHKLTMLKQICSGMATLTHAGLVHRDLALRNVLVFAFDAATPSTAVVKITDFGLAVERHHGTHAYVQGDDVPFRWMSPEALKRRRFSEKSDVWAFAVTAWELLTGGDIPFGPISSTEVVTNLVIAGERLPRPDSCCSDTLWDMMVCCWSDRPEDRPSFNQLVEELATVTIEGPKVQNDVYQPIWTGLQASWGRHSVSTIIADPRYWYCLGFTGGGELAGRSWNQKECYQEALRLDPEFSAAWFALGSVGGGEVRGRQWSKEECFRKALQLDPEQYLGQCNAAVRVHAQLQPETVVCCIGSTGTGKSSLCNTLCGARELFTTSDSTTSCTGKTTVTTTKWSNALDLGDGKGRFTLIDTPGLGDTEGNDTQNISEMVEKIKRVKHVNAFVVVFNGQNPRFDEQLQGMMQIFADVFGEAYLAHCILCFTRWPYDRRSKAGRGVGAEERMAEKFNNHIRARFDYSAMPAIRCVFIDNDYEKPEIQSISDLDEIDQHVNQLCIIRELAEQLPAFDCRGIEAVMAQKEAMAAQLEQEKKGAEAKLRQQAQEAQEREEAREREAREREARERERAEAKLRQQAQEAREREEARKREARERELELKVSADLERHRQAEAHAAELRKQAEYLEQLQRWQAQEAQRVQFSYSYSSDSAYNSSCSPCWSPHQTSGGNVHWSNGSANGSPLYSGPRGGTYYINSKGNKTYVQR